MTTNDENLKNYEKVTEAFQNKYPAWNWEDVAMWIQKPNKEFGNKSPHQLITDGKTHIILTWIDNQK